MVKIIMDSLSYSVFDLLALKGIYISSIGLKPMKFGIYHVFCRVSRNHEMLILYSQSASCRNMIFLKEKSLCFTISGK